MIVGLATFFALSCFGIATFIALRALWGGHRSGTVELQHAASPTATATPDQASTASSPEMPGSPPAPALPPNPASRGEPTATPTPAPTLAVATPREATVPPEAPASASKPVPSPTGSDDGVAPVERDSEEERRVRQEVLMRIDLLQELSQAEKDHLYSQVERARGFTKLAIVPFPSGQGWPDNGQVEHLLSYLRKPGFQKLFEDPTVVVVCAGYADLQGAAAQNLELSRRRAESMVRILQTRTKIRNLMRAVGMGGSDMFDKHDAAKNRVVEIWLVQP